MKWAALMKKQYFKKLFQNFIKIVYVYFYLKKNGTVKPNRNTFLFRNNYYFKLITKIASFLSQNVQMIFWMLFLGNTVSKIDLILKKQGKHPNYQILQSIRFPGGGENRENK